MFGLLVLAVGIAVTGCDSLLDVSLPGSTPAEALDDPTYASLLVVSAQGNFEDAFNTYIFNAGHIAGELVGGQSALAAFPFQRRDVRSLDTQNNGLYNGLSTARWAAETAHGQISAWSNEQVANRSALLGRAALYTAFSYTVFADGFCRAAFDLGPAVTPAQTFTLAEEWFTKAIEAAGTAGDTETLNAAYVGRARVRLSLGKTAEALADATMVPVGFNKVVTRSTSRANGIYEQNVRNRAHSIDPNYWDVEWMGVADPRVALNNTGTLATDGLTPLWTQTKYATDSAPIRLASYVEAQLIIAEISGGATAVGIINDLHAAAGIPAFGSDDPVEIQAQIVEERRRAFFLEGRRLGDLRRYGGFEEWTYGTNPFVGYDYGRTQCFPLPDSEVANNPNVDPTDGRT